MVKENEFIDDDDDDGDDDDNRAYFHNPRLPDIYLIINVNLSILKPS
jgi:hypothetical protein